MRYGAMIVLALLGEALSPSAATAAERRVAVTVDDLPFVATPRQDNAYLVELTRRLVGCLRDAVVPAVGFVNEGKLYRGGQLDPERVDMLRAWLEAGLELGNHTHSHLSLHRVEAARYIDDIRRGETVTRPLMAEYGRTLRWFRHPFLHLGRDRETRETVDRFLADHGYTVAPVTINNGEWRLADAYARAGARGDGPAAGRIGRAYLRYMLDSFADAERTALAWRGRAIPHVLLVHANALNADWLCPLFDALRDRGYRFIALDEALQDPVYGLPVGYGGPEGISWLDHWVRQAGLSPRRQARLPSLRELGQAVGSD